MSPSHEFRSLRKLVPEIGVLDRDQARLIVATAWRSAFMEHRIVGTLMIPGMILLAFSITTGIAALLDLVFLPSLAFVPHILRLAISFVVGYLVGMPVAMLVYDRWRVRLIAAKLRA